MSGRLEPPAWLRTTRGQALLLGIVGAVVFGPGLASPYWLDDYGQRAMSLGTYPSQRNPFDLYNFVTDADRQVLIDSGVLPWWTHPHLTIRFFRPLSSVLRWLDFRVFADHPLPHHLHSFVWWGIVTMAAWLLYRQWLSARVTLIATCVFAFAPCHALPLSWLANREVIVSLAFGIFALRAQARFCDKGRATDGLLACVLVAMSMLGGEYAFALGGYFLCMAVTRSGWARKLVALLPFAIPAAATFYIRRTFGYENSGSGFYRDPISHTAAFLDTAPRRLGRLLFDAWLASDSDWLMTIAPWAQAVIVVAIAALVAFVVRTAIAAQTADTRRHAWIFVVGSLMAIAPMASTLPSPRLLGATVLGVAPIVALVIDHHWFAAALPKRRTAEFQALLALVFGFFHLVHGPITSFITGRLFREGATDQVDRAKWLGERGGGNALEAQYVIARSGWQTLLFLPLAIDPSGRPPKRWWVLSLAVHALMRHPSEQTVELIVPRGRGFFPTGPDDLFRSEDAPLQPGDSFHVPGMRATVIANGTTSAAVLRFEFEDKLDSLVWVADGRDGFHEATPPKIGFGRPLDF